MLSRDIMTDLENIITIQEDRITENEGNHVYRTSIARRRNPNTQGSLEQRLERRLEELESKARRLESQTNRQTNKQTMDQESRKHGSPPEEYQFPCKNCKDLPGTKKEQQDICTNLFHCRYHNGEYMCTLSPKCKERTSKIGMCLVRNWCILSILYIHVYSSLL